MKDEERTRPKSIMERARTERAPRLRLIAGPQCHTASTSTEMRSSVGVSGCLQGARYERYMSSRLRPWASSSGYQWESASGPPVFEAEKRRLVFVKDEERRRSRPTRIWSRKRWRLVFVDEERTRPKSRSERGPPTFEVEKDGGWSS